jgi:hypothetical protein
MGQDSRTYFAGMNLSNPGTSWTTWTLWTLWTLWT